MRSASQFRGESGQALKRLRALKMIDLRIRGNTMETIEKELGLSPAGQKKLLDWAEKANLVAEAEDQILKELVPNALSRVNKAILEEGDTQAALEVLKGAGIFKKASDKSSSGGGTHDAGNSLEVYIKKIRGNDAYKVPPIGETTFAARRGEGTANLGDIEKATARIGEIVDEIEV